MMAGMSPQLVDDDRLLLNALADGELDAATAMALERRIAAEPTLAAEFDLIAALKDRVAGLDRPPVSADLKARVAALGNAGAAAPQRTATFVAGWRAMAASVLVTAVLASGATVVVERRHPGFSMEDAIAGSHRRSLLAANPVDIASSDRHTVKPWLDAKLGISPPATDLAILGYPLVGGRVDVLGAKAVPTLVYRHNEHLITVVAVPGSHAETQATVEFAGGYNMVRWNSGGFSFWAVSDLEPGELQGFVTDYRSAH